MKHHLERLLCLLSVLILLPFLAAAEQGQTLETLQRAFEDQERVLLDGYGKSLDSLLAELKKKGDIDAYLVVESEKKRFEGEKKVGALAAAPPAFKSAVAGYRGARVDLLKKYISALEGYIKAEMNADRIDNAKAGKAEKDRIAFDLADEISRLPAEPAVEAASQVKKEDAILGVWNVAYDNTVRRRVEFSKEGTGTKIETEYKKAKPTDARSRTFRWKWSRIGEEAFIEEMDDGRVEVWTRLADGGWQLAHYEKPSYPKGKPKFIGKAKR